jgi:hypothetical protein
MSCLFNSLGSLSQLRWCICQLCLSGHKSIIHMFARPRRNSCKLTETFDENLYSNLALLYFLSYFNSFYFNLLHSSCFMSYIVVCVSCHRSQVTVAHIGLKKEGIAGRSLDKCWDGIPSGTMAALAHNDHFAHSRKVWVRPRAKTGRARKHVADLLVGRRDNCAADLATPTTSWIAKGKARTLEDLVPCCHSQDVNDVRAREVEDIRESPRGLFFGNSKRTLRHLSTLT